MLWCHDTEVESWWVMMIRRGIVELMDKGDFQYCDWSILFCHVYLRLWILMWHCQYNNVLVNAFWVHYYCWCWCLFTITGKAYFTVICTTSYNVCERYLNYTWAELYLHTFETSSYFPVRSIYNVVCMNKILFYI